MEAMSDYFRALGRQLNCPRHIRKPFLDKTRQMAKDFIQGKPDATPQEVGDYLGDPKELAEGFLETLDPEMLERYQKRKKLLLYGCVAALLILLVIVSAWCILLWHVPQDMEITNTIIIYSENVEGA